MVSLTTMTGVVDGASRSVKKRPPASRIPIVSKKRGVTNVTSAVGSSPGAGAGRPTIEYQAGIHLRALVRERQRRCGSDRHDAGLRGHPPLDFLDEQQASFRLRVEVPRVQRQRRTVVDAVSQIDPEQRAEAPHQQAARDQQQNGQTGLRGDECRAESVPPDAATVRAQRAVDAGAPECAAGASSPWRK